MPAGRPSKYDPAFCDKVISLGEIGASVDEMAYECGVCENTLNNWAEAHEEFLIAFTRAKIASQVWWERKGRSGMEKAAQEFQGNIWSRNMAARFPRKWREVKGTELTGKDGTAIPIAQTITIDPSKLSDDALREITSAKIDPNAS
jgi:hypothetical protein